MRDFVFVMKSDSTKKATLRTDIVEDKIEKFTVMWCEGVKNTEFESIIPWKCGSVISMTDLNKFAIEYQSVLDGYMYGSEQMKVLGAPTHKLTVTATVTGSSTATAILKGTKEGALPTSDIINFTTAVAKELVGIEGYSYTWELPTKTSWTTSAPAAFVCTQDKTIALAVTVTP